MYRFYTSMLQNVNPFEKVPCQKKRVRHTAGLDYNIIDDFYRILKSHVYMSILIP